MKLNKYTWIFVGLIAAVYLGTLLWVRLTNPVYLQQNMYRTWEKAMSCIPELISRLSIPVRTTTIKTGRTV